jgi:hypothetical protein
MSAGSRVVVALSVAALVAGAAVAALPRHAGAQDTVRVEVSYPGVWGTAPHLVEEVRIGRLDGEAPYLLGSVGPVAACADGTIFVVDRQGPIVRMYSAEGEYEGDVGRVGSGPGEYRSVLGLRLLPDGSFALWDPGNGRVSVYEGTGRFSHGVPVASGLYTADPFQVDTTGNFYVKAPDPTSGAGTGGGSMAWLRISPEGTDTGSLPIPPERTEGPAFLINTAEGPRRPFPTTTSSALSPHGYLVTGRNDEYSFRRLLPNGRVLEVAGAHEPLPIRGEERRQWEAWINFFEGGTGERYPSLPRVKPAFRELWVDEDGRIWVARYVEARRKEPAQPTPPDRDPDAPPPFRWREPATYDVFEPDGTFMGTLELPWGTVPRASRGDRVWAVTRGELGEQYVVRLRIVPDR